MADELPQQAPQAPPAPAAPPMQEMPPSTTVKSHSHTKLAISIALAVVVIIAAAVILPPRTPASSTIPTSPVTTPVQTITAITQYTINPSSPLGMASNTTSVLYGVPINPPLYLFYNFTSPIVVDREYGMNFTEPTVASNSITPPTEIVPVPAQYASVQSPLIAAMRIYTSNSTQSATAYYNTQLSYIIRTFNSTQLNYTPLGSVGIGSQSYFFTADSFGMKVYGVLFQYSNYTVQLETFGNLGLLSDSYALSIANHIYNILSNR